MKTQKDFTQESSKKTVGDATSNESTSTTRLFIDDEEHGVCLTLFTYFSYDYQFPDIISMSYF